MKYDENGFPLKEYYTEELNKTLADKIIAVKRQKYYTGSSIVLMLLVLICTYFILN